MSRRKSDQENEAAEAGTDATLAPSSLSDEQADQLAKTYTEPGNPSPPDGSFSEGYNAAHRDMAVDQRHLRESILLSCVQGIRIPVKDGESPGAVALRVVEIVEKILLRAGERGLIAQPAQQGEIAR